MLYDSPVILEYLDHRAGGGKIIPKDAEARFAALTLQALCDGILDAGILLVYEGRWRPAEMAVQKWIDHQRRKVKRAFDVLEAAPPRSMPFRMSGRSRSPARSAISDLRFERQSGAASYPKLVKWHDEFEAQVPAFEQDARHSLSVVRGPKPHKAKAPGAPGALCFWLSRLVARDHRAAAVEPVGDAGTNDLGGEARGKRTPGDGRQDR